MRIELNAEEINSAIANYAVSKMHHVPGQAYEMHTSLLGSGIHARATVDIIPKPLKVTPIKKAYR